MCECVSGERQIEIPTQKGRQEKSVRQWNSPTQAKERLEWATDPHRDVS
jgi:hypothetical protein